MARKKDDPAKLGATLSPGEVYTLGDLSSRLGLSRKTILRWCTENGLDRFSTRVGASWFVTTELFAKWIESLAGQDSTETDESISQHVDAEPRPAPTSQKLSAIQLVYPAQCSVVVAKAINNPSWWDLTYPNAWSFFTADTENKKARKAIEFAAQKGLTPPFLALWTGSDALANAIPLPSELDEVPQRVQEALK